MQDLVNMRKEDGGEVMTGQVPRHAYEDLWFAEGWREFDPSDPDAEFEDPVVLETAQTPDDESVGVDTSEAVPADGDKDSTLKRRSAASAADKE